MSKQSEACSSVPLKLRHCGFMMLNVAVLVNFGGSSFCCVFLFLDMCAHCCPLICLTCASSWCCIAALCCSACQWGPFCAIVEVMVFVWFLGGFKGTNQCQCSDNPNLSADNDRSVVVSCHLLRTPIWCASCSLWSLHARLQLGNADSSVTCSRVIGSMLTFQWLSLWKNWLSDRSIASSFSVERVLRHDRHENFNAAAQNLHQTLHNNFCL